jgi:hypothetical protein
LTNETRPESGRVIAQGGNLRSKRIPVSLNTLENLLPAALHRPRPSCDLVHSTETALDALYGLFNRG